MLHKLNFLSNDGKISITNVIVFIFVIITAFKELFSGITIITPWFNWKIESLDVSSTLPLLFSLINYGHKRQAIITNEVLKNNNINKQG